VSISPEKDHKALGALTSISIFLSTVCKEQRKWQKNGLSTDPEAEKDEQNAIITFNPRSFRFQLARFSL
jgi:hypothetical protein